MREKLNSNEVVKILREDGVVVVPTDTVWGVVARISSKQGVERFYKIKNREMSKPSQVLVASIEMAREYGKIEGKGLELAKENWPGGLTLVVEANLSKVPEMIRAGGKTVGLRVPSKKELVEMIERLGEGLIASSANVAGGSAPGKRSELDEEWILSVDGVMEGEAGNKASSTVVEVINGEVKILRQGGVKIEG